MLNYKEYLPALVMLGLAVLSVFVLTPLLFSIIIGALFAYLLFPLYKKFSQKLKNKSISAFLVCFLVLLLLIIPGAFLMNGLVKESYSLYILAKQKLATGIFTNCQNDFCLMIKDLSNNPDVYYQFQQIFKSMTDLVIKKGSDLLLSVPRMIIYIFVVFFTMFYFLRDGEILVRNIGKSLALKNKHYEFITKRASEITSGLIYGYFLVALIQGALGALGFFIFGVPSPLFWGTAMGILALIPYLGTGFIWIPAALILFLEGVFNNSNSLMFRGAALGIYSLIFVSSIDNFLRPRIMGKRARVHPAIVFLGVLGGIFVFGPIGVFIGPLILSLTTVLIQVYLMEEKEA